MESSEANEDGIWNQRICFLQPAKDSGDLDNIREEQRKEENAGESGAMVTRRDEQKEQAGHNRDRDASS